MKKPACLVLALITILSLASCSRWFAEESGAPEEAVSAEESTYNTYSIANSIVNEDIKNNEITPLLWKITNKESGAVLWLFGSCDLADEKALSLPDAVMNAYESSKNMLVVTNEYDDTVDFQELYKQFQYSDGSTLKKHIPEELYQKAGKIISDNYGSCWVGPYEQYNPIFWTILIKNTYLADCPLTKSVNEYFISKAKQDGKHISSVESIESYYKNYIDLSEEVQIFKLRQMTDISRDDYLKQTVNFYDAWAVGASGYIEKPFTIRTVTQKTNCRLSRNIIKYSMKIQAKKSPRLRKSIFQLKQACLPASISNIWSAKKALSLC